MTTSMTGNDDLTDEQRAWLAHSEALWRQAREIVRKNPLCDVGNVYHALRCLELSPAERLHRGLTRVRREPNPRGKPTMKPALQDALFAIEPRWFSRDGRQRSAMPLGFECRDGWFEILRELLVSLKDVAGPDFAIGEAVEEDGVLQLSVVGASDAAMRLVRAAERKSRETCESCCQPATRDGRARWGMTLCPHCQQLAREREL